MPPETPSMDLDKIVSRTESETYNNVGYNQSRKSIAENESSEMKLPENQPPGNEAFDEAYAYKNQITKPVTEKQKPIVGSINKPQKNIIDKSVFNIFGKK